MNSKHKWWVAKENPSNRFDGAPIFWTVVIAVYVVVAIVPAFAMISKPFACAIGAVYFWCK